MLDVDTVSKYLFLLLNQKNHAVEPFAKTKVLSLESAVGVPTHEVGTDDREPCDLAVRGRTNHEVP